MEFVKISYALLNYILLNNGRKKLSLIVTDSLKKPKPMSEESYIVLLFFFGNSNFKMT